MGRKCIVCGELFGCQRSNINYLCIECRLVDGCSIKNYFSTTYVTSEICPDCKLTFEKEQRHAIGINHTPALQ
jgi:hypothetical protein